MSLSKLKEAVTYPSYKTSSTYFYILRLIDWVKLQNRMYKAWKYPNQEQRCVLFEYDFFDLGPIQGQTLHACLHRQDFVEFMNYMFKENNPRIQIYSRRKIVNGVPSFMRRQYVIVFQSWSLVPPPPPSPILQRQNAVCLDEYLDDESTTISSVENDDQPPGGCYCHH